MDFRDATISEIKELVDASQEAFAVYGNTAPAARAALMRTIAMEIEALGESLIETAARETNLPETRLRGERARTVFQLNFYADACEQGLALEARIDVAKPAKNPPAPDLRKMMVPLGPVVVFGSSNFPFAYSTAGGDTACALAAGCTVVVKAHPAHPQTSEMVAGAIKSALKKHDLPSAVFTHLHGASFKVGKELIMHAATKAVGFTGSFAGGKQLYDWAQQREFPIPVFAEMGSVNPVFILPGKLKDDGTRVAEMLAASVTLGVGQFCTNPGLIIGIESDELTAFIKELGARVASVTPAPMLHEGIAEAYKSKKEAALAQHGVDLIASAKEDGLKGAAAIATVSGDAFIANPRLHQEVFGPYSLVVRCSDAAQLQQIAANMEGQLTSGIMATEEEMANYAPVISAIQQHCGRVIFNGVPTGVEVCWSMQHGGPFPATTDSRFTSVGPDGIKRFTRPLSYQNWPDTLLPPALQDGNPLGIWRMQNNEWTKAPVNR